jgi:Family of unknown function (DUF6524)
MTFTVRSLAGLVKARTGRGRSPHTRDREQGGVIEWVVLAIVSIVLGVGMSWSHVRRRMSGQADVTTVDRR